MSFNDIYLHVLPWIFFDVFQMVAVPENDLKLNCLGLAVYFHWRIHSVSHLEHCGATGYIPATIPYFRVFTVQLGDLIMWCQMPGVHLCHTDNLCHRKPKGNIGPGGGDIWASSGKKRPSKARRRRVGTFSQSRSRSQRFRHCDVWRCWGTGAFWSTLDNHGQAGYDLIMKDLKPRQRNWNAWSSQCLTVLFLLTFLIDWSYVLICLPN